VSHRGHQDKASALLSFAVPAVSDSRKESTDESGRAIQAMPAERGHGLAGYRTVPTEPGFIRRAAGEWFAGEDRRGLVVNGGSAVWDWTAEAVEPLPDRPLPGFEALLLWLFYQEIGPAAMLHREPCLSGQA